MQQYVVFVMVDAIQVAVDGQAGSVGSSSIVTTFQKLGNRKVMLLGTSC